MDDPADVQRALGRIEGKLAGIEQRLDGIHSSKVQAHTRLGERIDDVEVAQEAHEADLGAHGGGATVKVYDRWTSLGAVLIALAALLYSIFGGGDHARSAQAQEVPARTGR